jgi:hypothetical protein
MNEERTVAAVAAVGHQPEQAPAGRLDIPDIIGRDEGLTG